MQRTTIIAIIAVLLLVVGTGVFFDPRVLLLLLVFPVAYFFIERRKPVADAVKMYASVDEVTQAYGEPDDVVVLDASKANELSSLVLFYRQHDKAVVAGYEMKLSDIVSVAPKNMATPYVVDEYAVVLTTTDTQRPTIRLRVGYDAGLAEEIAQQIYCAITDR